MSATKAQERKALEAIKKIIEDLGSDSYIATAFDGCLDLAETNITNDWACSMKQRYESAEEKRAELAGKLREAELKIKGAENQKTLELEAKNKIINDLSEDKKTWAEIARNNKKAYEDADQKAHEAEKKIEEQEREILTLKAKLYDYMTR